MYMITIEDRVTKHRAKAFFGCFDFMEKLILASHLPTATFQTSEWTEIHSSRARNIIMGRLSNDQELIDRAVFETEGF
jgi:hypothetical protein